MPKIDAAAVAKFKGSFYPEPYASQMGDRSFQALGDAGGLTQFGASLVTMTPGSRSSLRHWHHQQDEFACILSGELVLHENDGQTTVRAGDFIAWPKGEANGHCLENQTDAEARFLVIGTRAETDICVYSDVDLEYHAKPGGGGFTGRGGAPRANESGDET